MRDIQFRKEHAVFSSLFTSSHSLYTHIFDVFYVLLPEHYLINSFEAKTIYHLSQHTKIFLVCLGENNCETFW